MVPRSFSLMHSRLTCVLMSFLAARQVTAYVPQHDVLLPSLTVAECIAYSARLRLPRDATDAEVAARVIAVLTELRLTHVANCLVGGGAGIRGVSGGERRRVSIGMEVVTGARFVVMDEATSGELGLCMICSGCCRCPIIVCDTLRIL